MKRWITFQAILIKDVRSYYLKPPNLSWGLLFPLAWTLMFFLRSQGPIGIRSLLPGVMTLSVLFGTTSMLAVTVTFERKGKSFERLLQAPIPLGLLVLAKTSGAILFGTLNALVPFALAAFYIPLEASGAIRLLTACLLLAFSSAFLGLLVAVSVQEVFEAQTLSNFFRFPMVFLCGLFFPLERVPLPLRSLSYILPPTYGVDLLRGALGEEVLFSTASSLARLTALCTVLALLCLRAINRHWID